MAVAQWLQQHGYTGNIPMGFKYERSWNARDISCRTGSSGFAISGGGVRITSSTVILV